MQLYELVEEFFELGAVNDIKTFADFLPWFVRLFASLTIFGVVVRMFMSLLISFTRGIK